jgi:hypothetical protein
MTKNILLIIAGAITTIANLFGSEHSEMPTGTPDAGAGGDAPKRRGRPPGATAAAAEEPETKGKTLDELKELVKPLIEDGQRAEVQAIIKKYGSSLSQIPADKQAAFVKDIEALIL